MSCESNLGGDPKYVKEPRLSLVDGSTEEVEIRRVTAQDLRGLLPNITLENTESLSAPLEIQRSEGAFGISG